MIDLRSLIRPVTERDREVLETYSYSRLDVFKKCQRQGYLKYILKKKADTETSLALELGTLCHYLLQKKGEDMFHGNRVDYGLLDEILENGIKVEDDKTNQQILGAKELKKKYFEEWLENDNASGMNYDQKLVVFKNVLHSELGEDINGWTPIYFEKEFEFVYNNRIILTGFIDCIYTKKEYGIKMYKTVDYKTSKKVYDNSALATSMQFGIYAMAILNDFGVLPTESMYRFILIDDKQYALTKGWEDRLVKALDKLLDKIDEAKVKEEWKPSPSPLCAWCDYSKTNPNAHEYCDECEYHSLWTPNNKTFDVNKEWHSIKDEKGNDNRRKLIF